MNKEIPKPVCQSEVESALSANGECQGGVEETLIIVKPDGLAKGAVGRILFELEKCGLSATESITAQLQREWVKELYALEKTEDYFEDAVAWVSSAPVLLLRVQGPDAVRKVKHDIIGKYPNGIRGKYSEDWLKNIAHAPDSVEAATRELNLSESIFQMTKEENKERFKGKMVFALTGMSESGKSTVGRCLDSQGIPRMKIGEIFERVRGKQSPEISLDEFVAREEQRNPIGLWNGFIDKLMATMDEKRSSMVSIESLYGGGLGPYLKQRMGDSFDIVYLDIPQETRLQRQMIREGLFLIDEAKSYLLPRDEEKAKSGIPSLKKIAGEVIDNSGTIDDLHRAVDKMVAKHRERIEHKIRKNEI